MMSTKNWRRPISAVARTLAFAIMLPGCAALPLATVGGWAAQAGGSALVKTGTEYTSSGTAHRTFTVPVEHVHAAVLEAFHRTDISIQRDEASAKGQLVVGEAQHRTVRIELTPLTPTLTSMELVVKRNMLAKDRATASELLAQTEKVLAEQPRFAHRLDGIPKDSARH